MKYYILTRVYYKTSQPTADFHASTLYITDDKAKLENKLSEEHSNMINFFKEVCEEQVTSTRNYMQMHPDLPYGYCYLGKQIIGYLIVTYAENVCLPAKDEFKITDIVKFTADADTFFRTNPAEYECLLKCRCAQVIGVQDSGVRIEVLQSDNPRYYRVQKIVPKDIVVKVNL